MPNGSAPAAMQNHDGERRTADKSAGTCRSAYPTWAMMSAAFPWSSSA